MNTIIKCRPSFVVWALLYVLSETMCFLFVTFKTYILHTPSKSTTYISVNYHVCNTRNGCSEIKKH